jgi:hypothetical protein
MSSLPHRDLVSYISLCNDDIVAIASFLLYWSRSSSLCDLEHDGGLTANWCETKLADTQLTSNLSGRELGLSELSLPDGE